MLYVGLDLSRKRLDWQALDLYGERVAVGAVPPDRDGLAKLERSIMFGIANQLLAAVALAVGTTILINMGRAKYAWVTLAPLCFLSVTTLTAGYMSVRDNFWPMAVGPNPELHVQGYVDSICTSFLMVLCVIILVSAARRWMLVMTGREPVVLELAKA